MILHLVGGREGETIAGDLGEEFAARGGGALWYWGQALSCIAVRISPHRQVLPGLGKDLHQAVRTLRRNPGYAFTAMVCLAFGIGVNTSMYTLVDAILFQTLPVPDAGRMMIVSRLGEQACSYRDWQDFQRSAPAFRSLAAYDDSPTSVDSDGISQMAMVESVSANFAATLELKTQIGRWFDASDESAGADPVAVISDHAWARRFGRKGDAIGKRVRIESQYYRVIGVAQAGFLSVSPPHTAELWIPFTAQPWAREMLADPRERARPRVGLIGRLADGATPMQAQAQIRAADDRVRRDFPRDESRKQSGLMVGMAGGVGATPGARQMIYPMAALILVFAAVVLLIACVNVAGLLLSRSVVRRREMAVRHALGASRWRLARQTLVESLAIAAGGAALGLLLSSWSNRLVAASMPSIPHAIEVTLNLALNWRVLAYGMTMAVASAIVFGLAPVLEQRRVSLGPALKGESGGEPRTRQRDVYVIGQVGLSLVLLITSALLLRALWHARAIDPGFAMEHRMAARLYISPPEYTPETGRMFYRRALEQMRAMPGVRSAALSYTIPMSFENSACANTDRTAKPPRVGSDTVTPGYFETMQIPLLRGRDFRDTDQEGAPAVAIVNETLARKHWPDENAVGKQLWVGCEGSRRVAMEVVAVAQDAKYGSLDEPPSPFLYRPLAQDWIGFMAMVVQSRGEASEVAPAMRTVLRGLDPNIRIYEMKSLEQFAAESMWQVRWQVSLLGAFGMLAMVLAAVGLYGVVAYAVAQRTREIGIRIAVGAQRDDVLWMVLGRGLRLTGIGIAGGLVVSWGVTRFLRGFLYGVSPLDPVAFGGAVLFWTATAMVASYLPARRAARVDPVVALRWE